MTHTIFLPQFMIPVSYDRLVPVFTSHQIDIYGLPTDWGYEQFQVIDDGPAHVMDYDMEVQYRGNSRPIHRYNRRQRFLCTLQQLCGDRGKVPDHILTLVNTYVVRTGDVFQNVRKILKHYGMRIYYNRIPFILQAIGLSKSPKPTNQQYRDIMVEYDRFHEWFMNRRTGLRRYYFPSMRFLALKWLHQFSIELPYRIPLARTNRKEKELEEIWTLFKQVRYMST